MASNDQYILQLLAQINSKASDDKIDTYIKTVQQRMITDPKSKLNLSVKIDPKTGDEVVSITNKFKNLWGEAERSTARFNVSTKGVVTVLDQLDVATTSTVNANDKFIQSMVQSTTVTDLNSNATKGAANSTNGFTKSLGQSITTAAKYALSMGLVYQALNQVRQGLQYVIELNKIMVDTQLVSGASAEEINKLGMQYNSLAREMGSTTKEIAKGSLEFVRQGKTAAETEVLIRSSTMMAKLGNMEAADATEKLTSMMNGFKIEAEETGQIVDKLVKYCQNI